LTWANTEKRVYSLQTNLTKISYIYKHKERSDAFVVK